jgi:hypothetical protein
LIISVLIEGFDRVEAMMAFGMDGDGRGTLAPKWIDNRINAVRIFVSYVFSA